MKKLILFALVVTLLAVSIAPALAAGATPISVGGNGNGERKGGGVFALAGTISAVDSAAGTVQVAVVCGNNLVTPYIGQTLTLQTSGTTRFLLQNPDGTATPITFNDLAVGQNVSGNGRFQNNTWVTSRITVGASLTCTP